MPTFGSLFAGIGGIDLGLERAGWTGRWQVEYEPFCQRVLAKHWPDVPRLGDVHDVHGGGACPVADADSGGRDGRSGQLGTGWRTQPADGCPNCLPYVDLLAGGFPCQPFSNAGKRRGKDDERWLWPEFARLVGELRPRYVLVENVPGLLAGHGGMGAVLGDLAAFGYDAEWDSIPASAVGAPHLRYRVWIVAYARGDGRDRSEERDGETAERERPAPRGDDASGRLDPVGGRTDAGDGRMAGADVEDANRGTLEPRRGRRRTPEAGELEVADADIAGLEGDVFGRSTGEQETSVVAGRGEDVADPPGRGQSGSGQPLVWSSETPPREGQAVDAFSGGFGGVWSPEPDVGRVAHGVPARVDRLRSLGNAVVPQVVEVIGRRLLETREETTR